MAQKDLFHSSENRVAFDTKAITIDTTIVGLIIDTKGFESLTFLFQSVSISDGTFTPKIEDGNAANLSDAADVSTDFLLGTIAGVTFTVADGDTAKEIGVISKKRFVRVSIVSTGVSAGGTLSTQVLLADPLSANISASE